MKLDNASAVVTGGASGLGEASARALAAAGAKLVIADRDEARGQAVAKELGATFLTTDVTDPTQVHAALAAAVKQAPLRVVVQCAGIAIASRLVNKEGAAHDLEAFRKIITVNLLGTFNVMRLAAAAIQAQPADAGGQRGLIVNTASVAAFDGQIGQVAYSASKGGVVGMTLPAARDLAKAGIRVMTIAPGTFDTPMMAGLPAEARASLAAVIPNPPRLGAPAEYAKLVMAMVDNDYLNGEVIRLDGALRMAPK